MNIQKLIDLALVKGVQEVEVYLHHAKGFSCSLFEGEIDAYKVSNATTLAIRGMVNGKMGNVSTENLDEANYEFLIAKLIDNAKIMGTGFSEAIFPGSKEYFEVAKEENDFVLIPIEKKIQTLQQLEKEALNYDPRITQVDSCSYEEKQVEIQIQNSKGLKLARYYQYGIIDISVVAKEEDCTKNNFEYIISSTHAKLNPHDLVRKACKGALDALHPQKIATKQYPIILKNDVVASLLSTFERIFSGDAAVKGTTKLIDQVGKLIASPKLTIIDNPLYQESVEKAAFDDEGVACKAKKIIDQGVFTLFLNNLKTAAKLQVEPTGNGFKGAPTASVGVSSKNLYIEKGTISYEEMIQSISEGVIISDVQGLHAGVNTVSGDFSLQASGFYIKDGKIAHPVALLVLSGNFFTMLEDIDEIASDLKFTYQQVGAPSLKIKSMSISG